MHGSLFGKAKNRAMATLSDSVLQMPIMPFDYNLLDAMDNGLAIMTSDVILYANPSFLSLFGLKSCEGISPISLEQSFVQSTHTGDWLVWLNNPSTIPIEFQSAHTKLWYSMTLSKGPDDQMIALCSDISSFKRRDELLSFANKMEALGQLAGGVAHDFNNILSIIEGYGRLIMKQAAEGSPIHDQAGRILQAARRGAGITRQLLTFGRHQVVADGVTCLNDFLEEQKNFLLPLLDARVNLAIDIPPRQIYVAANSDTMAQILLNAVTNARDAMEEHGGQIMIVAGQEGEYVTLAIHDTGCGMDDKTRAQALEPFFTTKPTGKGTGLGLTQIYGLVQQIKGHVDLFSQVGRGTTLALRLPVGIAPVHHLDGKTAAPRDWSGQTILVVDDEPDLVTVMENMLGDHGFKVLTATSGNEALALQDSYEGKIDWLLSDVVMGDMSGPKLGELIQSVRDDITVIYMSGYPATGQMARIQLPSEALYLAKPIDPKQLLAIMGTLQHNDGDGADNLIRMAGAWGRSRS